MAKMYRVGKFPLVSIRLISCRGTPLTSASSRCVPHRLAEVPDVVPYLHPGLRPGGALQVGEGHVEDVGYGSHVVREV
jgi:hypothetical protein